MILDSGDTFNFFLPPYVVFGSGKRSTVPDYASKLGITKALLVVDPFFLATEFYAELQEGLKNAGIQVVPWSGVIPDPTDTSVDEAVHLYRRENCTGVICIGGGSALDTGKSVAVVIGSGSESIRFHMPPEFGTVSGIAPVICLPTTSGTGAEVNPYSMVTNEKTGLKNIGYAAWDMISAQNLAIVDPELTVSMPPRLTAITGIDALCQAIECFLTQSPNPISDCIALHAIKLIARSLKHAVDNGNDMQARINMSLAATMATIAFPNAGLSYPHHLSEPMADLYHIEHGVAVGSVLVATLEVLLPLKTERLAEIGQAFGVQPEGKDNREIAQKGILTIQKLLNDICFPTLSEATKNAGGVNVDVFLADVAKKKPDVVKDQDGQDRVRLIVTRSLEF